MCIAGKSAIIVIFVLAASLFAIADGFKCYQSWGDGKYDFSDCNPNEHCINIECDGANAGNAIKMCYPGDQAMCDELAASLNCTNANGIQSAAKNCTMCKGHLCNSQHIFTTTTPIATSPPNNTAMNVSENELSFKCYQSWGDGKYDFNDCDPKQHCINVECDGINTGNAIKMCYPGDQAMCDVLAASINCTNANGIQSAAKNCTMCKGHLCNSQHVETVTTTTTTTVAASSTNNTITSDSDKNGLTLCHQAAILVLIGIGAVIAVIAHFLF